MAETPKTVRSTVRGRIYFAPEGLHAAPVPPGWSELGEVEIPVTLDLSFGDQRSASEIQGEALLAARVATGTSPTSIPGVVFPPATEQQCLVVTREGARCKLVVGHEGDHQTYRGAYFTEDQADGEIDQPADDFACHQKGCLLFQGHFGDHEDAAGAIVNGKPADEAPDPDEEDLFDE